MPNAFHSSEHSTARDLLFVDEGRVQGKKYDNSESDLPLMMLNVARRWHGRMLRPIATWAALYILFGTAIIISAQLRRGSQPRSGRATHFSLRRRKKDA